MGWLDIFLPLISALGGAGGVDTGGLAEEGGALGGGAAGLSAGAGTASGLGDVASGVGSTLGGLGSLAGLGLQGAQLGMGLANRGQQGGQQQQMPQMPQFDQTPSNLQGQSNPQALKQRALGASADLQSRGLNVGAAPDFMRTQLEAELGLTPDEFQRIFRLGGGATGGAGAA